MDYLLVPDYVERKGSLYLRSGYMNYGRPTLNSNWSVKHDYCLLFFGSVFLPSTAFCTWRLFCRSIQVCLNSHYCYHSGSDTVAREIV